MMREVTLTCSVTILAQEVSPVSGVYDRYRFGADLLFLFLWRIVRYLSTRSMANVYAHAVRLPRNNCVEGSRLLSVDQWNVWPVGSKPSVCPLHQYCLGQKYVKLRCFTEKIRKRVFNVVLWKRPCAEQQKSSLDAAVTERKRFWTTKQDKVLCEGFKRGRKRMGANGNEGGAKLRRSDFICPKETCEGWKYRYICEVSSVSSDATIVSKLVLVPDVTACASCDPHPAHTHPRTHESQHVHPFCFRKKLRFLLRWHRPPDLWICALRRSENAAVYVCVNFGGAKPEEYAVRHFGRFMSLSEPTNPSEVGVLLFRFFSALSFEVINTVTRDVNVDIDCHLSLCCTSLYVSTNKPTLAADVRQSASRIRRNMVTLQHTSARSTRTYQQQQQTRPQSKTPKSHTRTTHSPHTRTTSTTHHAILLLRSEIVII